MKKINTINLNNINLFDNKELKPTWFVKEKVISDTKFSNKTKENETKENKIDDLHKAYIRYGHLVAKVNPLSVKQKNLKINELSAELYGFKETDNLVLELKNKFTSHIGLEIDHLLNTDEKQWILEKYNELFVKQIEKDTKIKILNQLLETEGFESFLNSAFTGAKRFSIEGAENYIPMTDAITGYLAERGTFEVIVCMAHRGRLATLTGITKKPYNQVMREFGGYLSIPDDFGSGDVKYHMGFESHRKFNENTIKVIVPFNPSHLECINPVGMGFARARQDVYRDYGSRRAAGVIMVHGDAAFSGQGIVAESLQMSQLKTFNSGGVVHIVINNQVGFTANPEQEFGGRYCTDIAKAIEAPIFHVNGDDAESCHKIAILSAMYKSHFCKDVVIDLVCYRKYGHNEGDEPMYTQPTMYNEIKQKSSVPNIYTKTLETEGVIDKNYVEDFNKKLNSMFAKEKILSEQKPNDIQYIKTDVKYLTQDNSKTAISKDLFNLVGKSIIKYSESFNINPKIKKLLEIRAENIKNNVIDWATAELLAYGSLLKENHYVNLTGQDVERGTFSHRHAVLTDSENSSKYNILNDIDSKQEYFSDINNSFLSEFGVLGFQYGYSLGDDNGLPIWEAQFGDFVNGAATIIDQFISSGETKWLQRSNLVMLLPHGMEGQGPEHSSARLERFLAGSAENNWIIANCTTPANLFHILRRQVVSKTKIPLVIMSPKSLLRHKLNISKIEDFTGKSSFLPVIGDSEMKPTNVKKIIITSGKIYYDLLEKRTDNSTAIIRIEQYYPFPTQKLVDELIKYGNAKTVIWAQEESANMGAQQFIIDYLSEAVEKAQINLLKPKILKRNDIGFSVYNNIYYVARKASSSPACGSYLVHNAEQSELLSLIFSI